MKKTIRFNIQSKGGAGKSMITYLQALSEEENARSYFVDFDGSAKSSSLQLHFLKGRQPSRFAVLDLLDDRKKLDRQLLFENLYELAKKDVDTITLDFGAPESDQFPLLFTADYSVEDLKHIETELDCRFVFNVIVAGGSAYGPCTDYLKTIVRSVNGHFEVFVYLNKATFASQSYLLDEVMAYINTEKDRISGTKVFGDFDETASPHKNILHYISKGFGMEAYRYIERLKILKELEKIK